MHQESETIKKTIEVENKLTMIGDFKEFDHEPTKEEVMQAVSDIVGDLIDSLQGLGKDIYDIKYERFIIVPKKPMHGYGDNTIGVKLHIEH